MKNEEAIRILEDRSNLFRKFQHIKESESVEISNTELNCPALLGDQYRKVADACDLAIRALRENHFTDATKMVPLTLDKGTYFPIPDTSNMEPLTLEQYNALDGRPVIVEKNTMKKWWKIAHSLIGDTCGYGRYWWAYAYPAHIDREAWEPCEFCGYTEYPDKKIYPKDGYLFYAGFTKQYAADDFHEEETEDVKFCPRCGRPLTPEAWAELGKRLRG